MVRKVQELKLRLMCIDSLRILKEFYTYEELSRVIKLPKSLLCRYVKGDILPLVDRALEITKITTTTLVEIIEKRLRMSKRGVIDIYSIAYDPNILRLASYYAFLHFNDIEIDRVLTAAVNGIPLAVMIAQTLETKLAVALKAREVGDMKYLEAQYFSPSPPMLTSLYLPEIAIERGERVLIVDDLLRTGRTLRALMKLVHDANARTVGVFALISLGEEWRKYIPRDLERVIVVKIVPV